VVPVPPVQIPTVGYPPPGARPDYPNPGMEPTQNWGMAYPTYAVPGYAVLVPRPPRPQAVRLAIVLTYIGVALSGIQVVLSDVWVWGQRDTFTESMTENAGPGAPDMTGIASTAFTVGIVLSAVFWLLPAAGTVVCAVLAGRGRNAARIVLACLAGVFAANGLCGAGSALLFQTGGPSRTMGTFGFGSGGPWWAIPFQFSLGALAVLICVLLLLPTANRYFSAGPGRRFAPSP
jgi:hypothetical protein